MADRIKECQEADVALRKAADAVQPGKGYADGGIAAHNDLRRAALAFAFACELAHVTESNVGTKLDEWHEAYPLDEEE